VIGGERERERGREGGGIDVIGGEREGGWWDRERERVVR
jgi:hypothetical protein